MRRDEPALPVRLVCFDLGHVLVRICDGWADACRRAGVPITLTRDNEAAFRAGFTALTQQVETGSLEFDAYARQVATLAGLDLEQVQAIARVWVQGAQPGAAELLEGLARRGVATACLSNTNAFHWSLMSASSGAARVPLDRLTFRFASHLIGAVKPDAVAYTRVERETGAAAGEILFFDDLAENCAAAAKRGWQTVQVVAGQDPVAQIRSKLAEAGLRLD